jgi:Tfp pilus assembly protein PilX
MIMNKRKRYSQKYERGSIVGLVLVIGVCLAIIGWGMLNMGFGSRVNSAKNTTTVIAREAADAGLTEALHLLNQRLFSGSMDFTGIEATDVQLNPPSSQPTYSYVVEPNGITTVLIHSTGHCRDQVRKVNAVTSLQSIWDNQFYGRLGGEIGSNVEVGVEPNDSGILFQFRTDSNRQDAIKIHPNVEFNGSIIVGPGGDPDIVISDKKDTEINGPTYAASEYLEFPYKTVPGVIDSNFPPSSGGIMTIPTGMYGFDQIIIGNGEKIYIEGTVTISTNSVEIKKGGEIRILSGGSLALYVDGNFIAKNDSYIYNDDMEAARMKIYGSENCTLVEIKNSGDFYGAIYAPNAKLDIKNSGDYVGSFIGSSIDVNNSGKLIFDASLSNPVEEPGYFTVARWWEEVVH